MRQKIFVRVVSDYDSKWVTNWLHKQSLNDDGIYSFCDLDVQFGTEFAESDYVLMINKVNKDTAVRVREGNIWALQQEPYIKESKKYSIPFKNEFAKLPRTYEQCDKVFGFVKELIHKNPTKEDITSIKIPSSENGKYIHSHPFMYYLATGHSPTMTYKQLRDMSPPPTTCKTKNISCIANSGKKAFEGHIDRINFVNLLKNSNLEIDYFGGEGKNFIKTKFEALLDYKYSIAIENSVFPYYFSEKIVDCFLAFSMPIYFGASEIDKFFPKESFIKIDINNPQEAIHKIQEALETRAYEKNLDAILESRKACLTSYNLIYGMGELIAMDFLSKPQTKIKTTILKGFKRSLKDVLHREIQRGMLHLQNGMKLN